MGVTVLPVALKSPGELDSVFSALVAQHPGTLQIVADSGNLDLSDRIAALAQGPRPQHSTHADFPRRWGDRIRPADFR
jgi:hypothetical protein